MGTRVLVQMLKDLGQTMSWSELIFFDSSHDVALENSLCWRGRHGLISTESRHSFSRILKALADITSLIAQA